MPKPECDAPVRGEVPTRRTRPARDFHTRQNTAPGCLSSFAERRYDLSRRHLVGLPAVHAVGALVARRAIPLPAIQADQPSIPRAGLINACVNRRLRHRAAIEIGITGRAAIRHHDASPAARSGPAVHSQSGQLSPSWSATAFRIRCGTPQPRHWLTALGFEPNSAAACPVPPRASMMSDHVCMLNA
jgi:hypothetical protein